MPEDPCDTGQLKILVVFYAFHGPSCWFLDLHCLIGLDFWSGGKK